MKNYKLKIKVYLYVIFINILLNIFFFNYLDLNDKKFFRNYVEVLS